MRNGKAEPVMMWRRTMWWKAVSRTGAKRRRMTLRATVLLWLRWVLGVGPHPPQNFHPVLSSLISM